MATNDDAGTPPQTITLPTFVKNAYGDLQIVGPLPLHDVNALTSFLETQIFNSPSCVRGVWLEIDWDSNPVVAANALPVLAQFGFKIHHAYQGRLIFQSWKGAIAHGLHENPTPPHAHTALGAGAFVINAQSQILAIREKFDSSGLLYPPGGHVDEGEHWLEAAVREAKEETGVTCVSLGIVAARELHQYQHFLGNTNSTTSTTPASLSSSSSSHRGSEHRGGSAEYMAETWKGVGDISLEPTVAATTAAAKTAQSLRFGSSHLAVHVLCASIDDTIAFDPNEIADCQWYAVDEFIQNAHPHIALMVAAAEKSGQIAAAADIAKQLLLRKKKPTVPTSTTSSSSSSSTSDFTAPLPPFLLHAHRAVLSRSSTATPGGVHMTAKPLEHVFYHAFPNSIFMEAAGSLPYTRDIQLLSGGGGLTRTITASQRGGGHIGATSTAAAWKAPSKGSMVFAAIICGFLTFSFFESRKRR